MDYARYLMLDPRSYELESYQLFSIDDCQFCGSKHFHFQRCVPTGPYSKDGVAWIQRCVDCKKTVSVVKK
jgi:hypothetical protein